MRRWQRLVVGLVLLSLLPGTALAQPDRIAEQLREVERREQDAREDLREVEQAWAAALEQLDAAERAVEQAREQLAAIDEELAAVEAAAARAAGQAESAAALAERRATELAESEAELADSQHQLEDRVRATFMYGQVSFLEAFTGVREISDLLTSTTTLGHVLAADRDLVAEVDALVALVAQRREDADAQLLLAENQAAAADDAVRLVVRTRAEQQRLAAELEDRRDDLEVAAAALEVDVEDATEHLRALAASTAQVEAELVAAQREAEERAQREAAAAAAAAEQAAQASAAPAAGDPAPGTGNGASSGSEAASGSGASSGSEGAAGSEAGSGSEAAPPPAADAAPAPPPPAASSGWLRPTAGRVTSPYGYRTHPVHGTQLLHTGVDLASGTGTPIRASRAGVVTTAGWIGGYGYTVVLYHGEGLGTLYAHMSAFEVGSGQQVSQGQVLGREGMTGTATGPHLHFEVRINGSPVDPCGYIAC